MDNNKKTNNNEELRPLDPKKYTARRVFRKYGKEQLTKPERKPFYTDFPKRAKEFVFNSGLFIQKNLGKIVISILLILIIIFVFKIVFFQKTIKASFIDRYSEDYIYGYVYLDDVFLGDTDGKKFKFSKEYCNGTHIVRLESESRAFEWQTYPIDCRSEKVVFYVDYEEAQPSKNIIFRFLDNTGVYYLDGDLYFDDVFIQYLDIGDISVLRSVCGNITKIRLESVISSNKWENNPDYCDEYNEIELKVSLEE